MIGGTYFVTAGELPAWVLAASLPYAVLVTAVLFGKHLDKLAADEEKGIRTLPVMLGDAGARFMTQSLIGFFFALVAILVLTGTLPVWTLVAFGAAPKLVKVLGVYNQPKPAEAPPGYPLWPLRYVAWAFLVTRRAGALLVAGLVLDLFWPLRLG